MKQFSQSILNHSTSLICIVLVAAFFIKPAFALDAQAEEAESSVVASPESRNQIIKFTDHGLVPSSLTMKVEDSIVFFVNDSSASLATLEIEFEEKHMHCGGGNLRAMPDGHIRSVRPFGPTDFATTCFHDKGDYKFTVFGLKNNPNGISSVIHVE